jgi:hypothetical protein
MHALRRHRAALIYSKYAMNARLVLLTTLAALGLALGSPKTQAQTSAPALGNQRFVKTTQSYNHPTGQMPADLVFRVVSESAENYTVTTIIDTTVELPKAVAEPITPEEAATRLWDLHTRTYVKYMNLNKMVEAYVKKVDRDYELMESTMEIIDSVRGENLPPIETARKVRERIQQLRKDASTDGEKLVTPNKN